MTLNRIVALTKRIEEGTLWADPLTGEVFSSISFKGKRLKGNLNNHGYLLYGIAYEGQHFKVLAHHVVWVSCKGPIPKDKEIDHRNRNKLDNRLTNLRTVTHQQNMDNVDWSKMREWRDY